MDDLIQACLDLLTLALERVCPANNQNEHFTMAAVYPGRVWKQSYMSLWAVSTTGHDILVNMRLPRLRRELEQLARFGPGADTHVDGVRYWFAESK